MNVWRIIIFSASIIVIVLLGLFIYKFNAGATVIVMNATNGNISEIHIKFHEGCKFNARLNPDEVFETTVTPSRPSGLIVEFYDSAHKQHNIRVDTYIDHNYSDIIYITLHPDGKAIWKQDVRGVYFPFKKIYQTSEKQVSTFDQRFSYEKHPGNIITKSKAEELAIAEFERNGIRQEDYVVSVAADNTGNKWVVSFEKKGKYPLPGEKHLVTVEKDGGKAVFMRGE